MIQLHLLSSKFAASGNDAPFRYITGLAGGCCTSRSIFLSIRSRTTRPSV